MRAEEEVGRRGRVVERVRRWRKLLRSKWGGREGGECGVTRLRFGSSDCAYNLTLIRHVAGGRMEVVVNELVGDATSATRTLSA